MKTLQGAAFDIAIFRLQIPRPTKVAVLAAGNRT